MKNSAVAIVPPLDSLFERLTVCFVCYPPSVAWRDGTSRVVFDRQHQVAFLGQRLRVRQMIVLCHIFFAVFSSRLVLPLLPGRMPCRFPNPPSSCVLFCLVFSSRLVLLLLPGRMPCRFSTPPSSCVLFCVVFSSRLVLPLLPGRMPCRFSKPPSSCVLFCVVFSSRLVLSLLHGRMPCRFFDAAVSSKCSEIASSHQTLFRMRSVNLLTISLLDSTQRPEFLLVRLVNIKQSLIVFLYALRSQ